MAGDRMSRIWSPATTIVSTAVAATARAEVVIAPSATLEAAQDRTIREWTVARIIGSLQVVTGGNSSVFYGIRVANTNEVFGSIDPGAQQTADWMWWGGVYTGLGGYSPSDEIKIDNRSQRKSKGMESELRFYILNAGPSTAYFVLNTRTLLLVP